MSDGTPSISRRGFFLSAAAAAGGAAVAATGDDKVFDGGFADVSRPGVPERKTPVLPPGAVSATQFSRRCVSCQLCVAQCPNGVLRPSLSPKDAMRPVMGFERGYCRPECNRCGSVCPAGAIRFVSPDKKRFVRTGLAHWRKDACIAAQESIDCSACERHCPAGAIARVPMDPAVPSSPKVPVVDPLKCTGCGACEHLCPARPAPGMVVEGYAVHRTVGPMGEGPDAPPSAPEQA